MEDVKMRLKKDTVDVTMGYKESAAELVEIVILPLPHNRLIGL